MPCCRRPRPRCRRRPRRRRCSRPRRRRARKLFACRPVCCMSPGPKTNNGYLNFLRAFRERCCGLSPQQTVKEGARRWKLLTRSQKERFFREARSVR